MAGDVPRVEPTCGGKTWPAIASPGFGRLSAVGILVGLGLWLHGLVGLLLLVAGTDLAVSRRPFAPRPVCWPSLGFYGKRFTFIGPATGKPKPPTRRERQDLVNLLAAL